MNVSDALTPEQEEQLARYRAGAMSAAERTEFEREAVASDALSEALYREASFDALTDERLATRPVLVMKPRRTWTWALTRFALPAAAAIALVVGVFRLADRDRGANQRDLVRGTVTQATLIEPLGEIAGSPQRFVWTRDPGAQSYRVDLYSPDGAMIGTAVTQDTTLGLAALTAAPLSAAEWQVVPLDADGLERPAQPRAAFHLRTP
jgi:hypothetical protein